MAPQVFSFPSHTSSTHPHPVPPSPRHPPPSSHLGNQRRLQPTPPNPSLQSQGNRINLNFPTSQRNTQPPPPLQPALSVVVELSESMSSSTHLDHAKLHPALLDSTHSDPALVASTPGSEGSTLKASSQSEFETDSLEWRKTPTLTTHPQSHAPPSSTRPHPLASPSGLPPTVDQFYQLTRQPSIGSPAPSSNTITNYAAVSGSTPLSPIWNLDLPQSTTGSNSSSSSDYIVSALAAGPAPLPGLRSNPRAPGLDSGHSTDEERAEEEEEEGGSSSSEPESLSVNVTRSLQWKRGKLLGKGAFGKVWEGLLDSAQMIAVKEVELDIVGQKAQSVSYYNTLGHFKSLRAARKV